MASTYLTPTIIAKAAQVGLENELVMGQQVYRDYEAEFGRTKVGDTVTIRRPIEASVKDGAILNLEDSIEGSLSLQINKQKHVGLTFDQRDLTLTIAEFYPRFLADPIKKLANQIDTDLFALYRDLNNWAGTPGQTLNSTTDFLAAPQRLDEMSVPSGNRYANLSPTDFYGMAGNFSGLFVQSIASAAIKDAELPAIGGIKPYQSNNVPTHTVGTGWVGGAPLVNGAGQVSTYSAVRTTMTQTLNTDGWATSLALGIGDVFTINGVFDVNPVTKQALSRLKQFVVRTAVTTPAAAVTNLALTIYPAIISSGTYQNVSAAPADNAVILPVGTGNVGYPQNMAFHRNAFALAMVPYMPFDEGTGVASSTINKNGLTITYSKGADITNFRTIHRLDVMYGVKTVDERLACRLSGAA